MRKPHKTIYTTGYLIVLVIMTLITSVMLFNDVITIDTFFSFNLGVVAGLMIVGITTRFVRKKE